MFMKKKLSKLALLMLSVSFLLLQGCGEKDSVSGYDGSSGTSVEQMIQDKLNGHLLLKMHLLPKVHPDLQDHLIYPESSVLH